MILQCAKGELRLVSSGNSADTDTTDGDHDGDFYTLYCHLLKKLRAHIPLVALYMSCRRTWDDGSLVKGFEDKFRPRIAQYY